MTRLTKFSVPPVAEVRGRLTAAMAEVRMLRRLLRLVKEADEAKRLRTESKEGER